MVAEKLLEALQAKQWKQGLSLRALATELGITQPYLSMLLGGTRSVTRETERRIQRYLRPRPSATLTATLDDYAQKNTHKSQRTVENLRERLLPFVEYLARSGIHDPLDITREHIDGFLRDIAKGR